ncbi:MAG: hypothetical protein HRU09_04415 [Oligoflexales bacterium]|nr:hypothetical protein [Oligoflexales bacterium]
MESSSNGVGKLLLFIALQCFSFLLSSSAHSRIDPYSGKGLLSIFKEKDQVYSPLLGLATIESGKIDELYEDHENDHAINQLVRFLFHKVDTDLLVTQLATNPASHLSVQSIGKIIGLLKNYPFSRSTYPYHDLMSKMKLTIILDGTYFTSHLHTIDRFNEKKLEIADFVRQYEQGLDRRKEADKLFKETLTLQNRQIKRLRRQKKNPDFLESELEQAIQNRQVTQDSFNKYIEGTIPASKFRSLKARLDNELGNLDINNYDYFNKVDDFVMTLIESYKSWIYNDEPINSSPVSLLLAYMWLKYDTKEDLAPYMLEMEQSGATKFSFEKLIRQSQYSYTSQDLKKIMSMLSRSQRAVVSSLSSHYEQVLLLKIIKPGNSGSAPITKYRVFSGTREQVFADCGENSIRNFINVLIYDREQALFDASILEKLNSLPGYQLLNGLIAYYQEHKQASLASENICYDEWNELISSLNHKVSAPAEERIKYFYKNRFDITGGYDNMQRVIKKVFGHSDLRKIVDDVNQISNKSIAFDDHELSDEGKNYGRIFIDDGQNEYTWGFQLIHFYFTRLKGNNFQADPISQIIFKLDESAKHELGKKDLDNFCFQSRKAEPYWTLLQAFIAVDAS